MYMKNTIRYANTPICLREAVLMSTHNLCFIVKSRKMYTHVHPSFTIQTWGVSGYSLHGFVITIIIISLFKENYIHVLSKHTYLTYGPL